MHRVRRLVGLGLAGLAGLPFALLLGTEAGCPGTVTPPTYTPVTGVTIHARSLLGGLSCGTGPGDVYEYEAVVFASVDGQSVGPLYSNVWDCFSDGVFDNLPPDAGADAGSTDSFFFKIYAFSYEGAIAAGAAAAQPSGDGDAGLIPLACPGGFGPNGTPCPFLDPSRAVSIGSSAQWTATCTADETSGVPVTAVCTPLAPVVRASFDAAASADASSRSDSARDAAPDAASDADAAPASDAAPDSPPDSPSPSDAAPEASDAPSG